MLHMFALSLLYANADGFFRSLLRVSLTAQEKGKWADYLHGEYIFCVLSLVAKQLLAWLNFGGAKALR